MIETTLGQAAVWCGAVCLDESDGLRFAGVSTDTRALKPGQLFVPLQGDRYDGHDYLEAAREAGAAASLWALGKPVPADPGLPLLLVDDTLAGLQRLAQAYLASLNAQVVGVTGSNGKTTTKDMIAAVLSTTKRVHKTEGNFNNHIGLPLTILRAPADTQVLVLEMGMSGAGEIAELSRLAQPHLAVITNIGESHLLQLGSRRNIAKAKLEIAEGLQPGGLLIVNGDEPLLREETPAVRLPEDARVVTFGEGEGNDLSVRGIAVTAWSTLFEVVAGDTPEKYEIPVPGRHNAVNAASAVAVGLALGLAPDRIKEGLHEVRLTGMRIERTGAAGGAVVLNDAYNASPTSMMAAIALLAELDCPGSKRLVLGDMLELGPDEAEFHAAVGRAATPQAADYVYAYGPLSAHAALAASSAYAEGRVRHFHDKRELIEALLRETGPQDLVLVKASRGMRMEEVVAALQKGEVG